MEVTLNTITDCDREIEINLTPEELIPHFDSAYKKAAPMIEIRGFRKGKAPLSVIKKMYGESIEIDALDDIANASFKKVIEEKDIHPIGSPQMVDMKYKRGEPLSFTIRYEIKPSIVLKGYKGIKLEKRIHRVPDEEVEAEKERLRHINAIHQETSRVEGVEYIVTADIQDLDESGTPMIGQKSEGMRIYLNEPTTEGEIKEALSSAEIGGVYRAKFQHKHADHTHTVHLQLTVKKIEKVILPEFDDAFVKKISKGKASTVEEFLKGLRADLERYWEEQGEKKVLDDLANEIVRLHEFPVPESLVKGVLDSYLEQITNQQPNKKLPSDFDEEKYRETYRPSAIWQAKWALIQEEIVKKEHIQTNDSDIEALAERESKRLNIDRERLIKFYKSSDTASDQIVNRKLLAFLRENAIVSEVVARDEPTVIS